MTDKTMDLSIIIVNYNGKEVIEKCLRSIDKFLDAKEFSWEIVVVDNASVDGSAGLVEKYISCRQIPGRQNPGRQIPGSNVGLNSAKSISNSPGIDNLGGFIKLIRKNQNLGFAVASNIGTDSSEGKYLLFLNPDTEFIEHGFENIVDFYKNKEKSVKVGMVGARIENSDGSLQYSCRAFLTLARQFYESYFLHKAFSGSRIFGSYFMTWWDHLNIRQVDWLSGAFLFCRREVFFGIGGFDKDYYMYSEDADICLKLARHGYSNYYYPGFSIVHLDAGIASENNALRNFQIWKSRILYFKKNYGRAHAKVFSMLYFAFTLNRMVLFYIISCFSKKGQVFRSGARQYRKSLDLFFQNRKSDI